MKPLEIGEEVFKQYTIEKLLFIGDTAFTYHAKDKKNNNYVILKEFALSNNSARRTNNTIEPFENSTEEFEKYKEKFKETISTLKIINNIQSSYIIGYINDFEEKGNCYVVTKYIDGLTLKEHLESIQRPLTCEELKPLLKGIIKALTIIHDYGCIHQDIKPSNIMIDNIKLEKENVLMPILIDFGSSRLLETRPSGEKTKAGSKTPEFAAPEQLDGLCYGAPTDIFAIGKLLYCCIGNNHGICELAPYASVTEKELKPLYKKYPSLLLQSICKATKKDSTKRFQSIKEFKNYIQLDVNLCPHQSSIFTNFFNNTCKEQK